MAEKFVNTYIALKTDRARNDGTYPLYLRLIIGRKIKNYPLKKFLKKEEWDENSKQATKGYQFHRDLNLLLSQKLTSAKQVIYRIENSQKPVTFNNFEAEYFGKVSEGNFFTYAKSQLKLWETRLAGPSYDQYETELGKLEKFNPTFFLADVDNDFLKRYDAYLRGTLKNKPNTIAKSMKVLRTFIIAAYKDELIPRNPFAKHKIKWEDADRTFLTLDEVDEMEKYLTTCPSLKIRKVVRYFLFCCYTGLRWGGVKELKYEHIRNGNVYMHGAEIPLTDRAKALIDWDRSEGYVFDVMSNQKTNDYIQLAFNALSFERTDQTLSFHSSRHTFGTISLNLGIPMDVVQALYNHKEQKTTRIYAKLLSKTKAEAMKVWELPKPEDKK